MNHRVRLFMQSCVLTLCLVTNSYAEDITQPAYLQNEQNSIAEQNYEKLRDVLPLYQNAVMHPWPVINTQQLLKKGVRSASVRLLRQRLDATNELISNDNPDDTLYNGKLAEAVKGFQERNGLTADGIVGQDTLLELNIPPEERVRQIEINMQRWLNLSPHLKDRYVLVNVPDYRLHVYEDNQEVLTMKAIVGKPTSQTPELESQIVRLEFNPPWNVPIKIAQKEMVKKIMEDPDYLDKNHIKIFDGQDGNAMEVNPEDVDWEAALENGFPYYFRQDPGEDNSLGLVKFVFENTADVYLHDTPAKELFNKDTRALSHGCVRLENAFALVDYLMQNDPEWNEDRMQEILSMGKTKYITAYKPTRIVITYITAWVDDQGDVNFRHDIYNKDF